MCSQILNAQAASRSGAAVRGELGEADTAAHGRLTAQDVAPGHRVVVNHLALLDDIRVPVGKVGVLAALEAEAGLLLAASSTSSGATRAALAFLAALALLPRLLSLSAHPDGELT